MTGPDVRHGAAALLLAAGRGERLGGQSKALLRIDGEPLVRRQVRLLMAAGLQEVVVVVGARAAQAREALAGLDVAVIDNPDHRAGQASSVMAGLAAVPVSPLPLLIALVDQPLLDAADLRAVLDAYAARGPARAVVPEFDGRRGNPVVVARAVVDAVLAGRPRAALRGWLDAHPGEVRRWSAPSDHFTVDLDTPADIGVLSQRTGWRIDPPLPEEGALSGC